MTTTNYTLTASNAAGTEVATVQVLVTTASQPSKGIDLPIIHSFAANPQIINTGETSTLSWSISNAQSFMISPTVFRQRGPIDATGNAPVSASVSPSVTTTYTLTAINNTGERSETATVTVNEALPHLNWTGTWDTNWGTMHLTQSMGKVTGTYSWDDGKIVGYISKNLTGDMLAGTWSEKPSYAPPDDAGDFEFKMAPDFNSFTGCWRYGSSGGWEDCEWHGTRLTP
jgi:hypothetical protein